MDILEEHIQQLMNEIKKKNKLIQNYFMGLETGALVSEESDIHKVRWVLDILVQHTRVIIGNP